MASASSPDLVNGGLLCKLGLKLLNGEFQTRNFKFALLKLPGEVRVDVMKVGLGAFSVLAQLDALCIGIAELFLLPAQ